MTVEFGRIVGPSGGSWSYQMTQRDALMLAKACLWEGGTAPDATLWTYAQRAYLRRIAGADALASMVEAHSQPLNPRWARTGEFCRPGGRNANSADCSEHRLARRDQAQAQTWEQLPPTVRARVVRFVEARTPNPCPRAVDFAQGKPDGTDTVTNFLARNYGSRVILAAGNLYLATAASGRWPRDFVTIQAGGRVAGPAASGGSAPLVALVLVALVLGAARVAG
jgi:hypothetical protein